MQQPEISIVIATYLSQDNLPILLGRISRVLSAENADYEIIVVDDASPDNSIMYLRQAASLQPKIKVISLSRNFGQQVAISAGLKYAAGDAVIVMDDDLQDPPEFIPALLAKWKEGYDVVYAIRKKRKEGVCKRTGYKIFYSMFSILSDVPVPENSGDFCLMNRKIVTALNNMNERDRMVRAIRAWVGYKQTGIEYERSKRLNGTPAYTLSKILKLSADGIISLSTKPLKLASWIGLVITSIAVVCIVAVLLQSVASLLNPESTIGKCNGFSPTFLAVILIGGIQLTSIGIAGEYIGRIYNEVRQRPVFLIKELIGFEEELS